VKVAHSIKWKWEGHVTGMDQLRAAPPTAMWDLMMGKRRTGRPKIRQADTVRNVARGHWSPTAKTWSEWHRYTQHS